MRMNFNSIVLRGIIVGEPQIYYYDGVNKTVNYLINVEVERNRSITSIPVLLPTTADISKFTEGKAIFVKGIVVTSRTYDEGLKKNIIKTIVEARYNDFLEGEWRPLNSLISTGYLVSKEKIWKNAAGNEFIAFLIASNRDEKASYIRCIAKFDRAHAIDKMEIGSEIEIHGYMYKSRQGKEYIIRTTWLKGFDEPYMNKSGYLFGAE